MKTRPEVSQVRIDTHRKFSRATAWEANGKVVWRPRLELDDAPSSGLGKKPPTR